jgi:hypothetical protein
VIGCYVIGGPGAGKSTLLRAVLPVPMGFSRDPVPHLLYGAPDGKISGAQIGVDHPTFPGTDRLSMAIQPRAIAWALTAPTPALIGEGDRLATKGFIGALLESCAAFKLLWLDTPPELAAERGRRRGSAQNPTWIEGRRTKVARLAETFSHSVVRLDGSLPLEIVAGMALEASTALHFVAGAWRTEQG